jgi:hypothetical protein
MNTTYRPAIPNTTSNNKLRRDHGGSLHAVPSGVFLIPIRFVLLDTFRRLGT